MTNQINSDPAKFLGMIIVIGIIGCVFFSMLLAMTGQGDHAESYRAWIIASSIILAGGIIAAASARETK